MKKRLLTILIVLLVSAVALSQEKEYSVEESMFGVQTGLFGVWVYNEVKLNNEFALRLEIGLDAGYSYSSFGNPKSQYILVPSISVAPRWYYNFKKRAKKGRSIANNGANFFSLKTTYNPDWFQISNGNNISFSNLFRIIPSWGFRRDLGANFNFDMRLGFGYGVASNKTSIANGWLGDFSVRFGYNF